MEEKIIADLKESYGITPGRITPVTGGLLNQKWKVSAEKGEMLVKQYSTERFNKDQIERIESALRRQIILEKNGVACPRIQRRADRAIRWLDDQTAYMVMDFCPGKTENADTITLSQMRSLGSACAVMHEAFSQLPKPSNESLPVFGGYTTDLLWINFNSRMVSCPPGAHDEYRKALLALEPILRRLGAEFFDQCPKGFAHEDFHSGNILFREDCVSAVVDFDRNCYSYVWHDIGRAILSFALEGSIMNTEKVYAFLEGYTRHAALTLRDIADALRLAWCIETPWWIRPEFFLECDRIPERFKDEMLWLTQHWCQIDAILGAAPAPPKEIERGVTAEIAAAPCRSPVIAEN